MDFPEDETGIHFTINHDLQNFHLLELPLSLVDLVTSKHPPILYLKSEPIQPSPNASLPPNAVLCTDDATFEVQQVQSSDSLHILQPIQMQGISSIPGDGLDTAGVTIIANCNMVLELVARPTSAVPYLKKRIPVYDASQLEAEMNRRAVEKGQIIHKQELLDDSPCCLKELEKGLAELCVFFTGEYIWRPSDAELLTAWKSFMSAVTVRGLHVNQSLQMSEVVDLMMEDGFTPPIIQAIFLRIALGIDDAAKGKLDPYVSKQTNKECSDGEDTSAYRNNCVPWVGSLLLRTLPSSGVTAEDFLLSWRDTLPERWREYARLELLEGQVLKIGENPTIVRSVVETDIPETSIKDPKDPSRWHGKFKGAG